MSSTLTVIMMLVVRCTVFVDVIVDKISCLAALLSTSLVTRTMRRS